MKVFSVVLFLLLAVSVSAAQYGVSRYTPHFNPTGLSETNTNFIVAPKNIIMLQGQVRFGRVVIPHYGTFSWSSSNDVIRVVVKQQSTRVAEIHGVHAGNAIITATDGLGRTATIPVTVKAR